MKACDKSIKEGSPPKSSAAGGHQRRSGTEQENASEVFSTPAKHVKLAGSSDPVFHFLQSRNLETFAAAFPHLCGRDIASFSEWLERNHDGLPKPQSFSEWISSIHDSIDEHFVSDETISNTRS